ncbi:hypothetical protein E1B28_008747 [Marasmius oreades]|uniref:U4/U6.U5 small nuclear ribonucleoprotein 27kDa protein domain-containing protein n=1 Tax=Marasmius oreades TaxID=181124 RepID=A0A9P7USP6_9AGAR|nr:uncharacterized protein E1B28_008747 [Marasmius oreades]KAG7092390.1 hypothetical protein E1B28_008747 [Marasmius oreades]
MIANSIRARRKQKRVTIIVISPTFMSSRSDRRRDRSWERGDRDRDRDRYSRSGRGFRDSGRRRSRSGSPRRGDRDRRDYRGERDVNARDRERDVRDREREGERERNREGDRERDKERDRDNDRNRELRRRDRDSKDTSKQEGNTGRDSDITLSREGSNAERRINLDSDAPDHVDDVEAMVGVEDNDSAMMTMMGMSGFGSTKGKHVDGNQEGAVSIKKMRTWRQYMNRRGGFNRPLDKIK